MSFADLGASAPVVATLDRAGITTPFPIQALVIPDAIAGHDVLAKSRTGSGKTIAFAIPITERVEAKEKGPVALVLVPTRELAVQVAEEMRMIGRTKGLRAAAVFGGASMAKQAERAQKAHVVVATPGRLDDLENRKMLRLDRIRIFVLDEADRMLDMGFQPQVDRIVKRLPRERQTLFFSATLDSGTQRLARSYTHDAVVHEISLDEGSGIQDASHRFVPVAESGKVEMLIEILNEHDRDLALVFVRTKRGADRLGHKLKAKGVPAYVMHGDMTQASRQTTLDRFGRETKAVLIATDVAARGIHLDNITHVINYDVPNDLDGYVHRTGRTARAGRAGEAITFVSTLEQKDVGVMASRLDLKKEFEESGLKMMPAATVYSSRGRRSSMRPPRKRR
ncbi:MAG TPA: DEAD/DEAH box helicase [Actinomycetota bacterium]|nr:DEAD/DEAH box helicase [Actinomycetota bacterium]